MNKQSQQSNKSYQNYNQQFYAAHFNQNKYNPFPSLNPNALRSPPFPNNTVNSNNLIMYNKDVQGYPNLPNRNTLNHFSPSTNNIYNPFPNANTIKNHQQSNPYFNHNFVLEKFRKTKLW